jgi:hypothetical protein
MAVPRSNVRRVANYDQGSQQQTLLPSLPLSFSFQSIYKLANLWPKDSQQAGPSRQASTKHENDMCSHSSDLGEASAGPMGPLAWGTFHVFQETLPYSGQPSLGARSPPHQNAVAAVAVCCSSRSLLWPGHQASNALYTEFGCTLPSSKMPEVFSTALERGFD